MLWRLEKRCEANCWSRKQVIYFGRESRIHSVPLQLWHCAMPVQVLLLPTVGMRAFSTLGQKESIVAKLQVVILMSSDFPGPGCCWTPSPVDMQDRFTFFMTKVLDDGSLQHSSGRQGPRVEGWTITGGLDSRFSIPQGGTSCAVGSVGLKQVKVPRTYSPPKKHRTRWKCAM